MAIAKRYYKKRNFLYLGRGINYPIALEGALKLKEISYIHAEGYAAGEMKHGPIALIDKDMPVVVLAPRDRLYEKTVSNLMEVKARNAPVIAFVAKASGNWARPPMRSLRSPMCINCCRQSVYHPLAVAGVSRRRLAGSGCGSAEQSGQKRDGRIEADSMRDGDEAKGIDLIAGAQAK